MVVAVLGATNPSGPPSDPCQEGCRGQILRFALDEGSVAGTLLETLVDAYPPMGSIAWIRPADAIRGDYNSDGAVDADEPSDELLLAELLTDATLAGLLSIRRQ